MRKTFIICLFIVVHYLGALVFAEGNVDENQSILVLHGEKTNEITGFIAQLTNEGIKFDPVRVGPFYDAPPKFYTYSQVKKIIDYKGTVIFDASKMLKPDKETLDKYKYDKLYSENTIKSNALWLSVGLGPGGALDSKGGLGHDDIWFLVVTALHVRGGKYLMHVGAQSAVVNTVTNSNCFYIGGGLAEYTC